MLNLEHGGLFKRMMRSLIWFRNDYRLVNNRCYSRSVANTDCAGGVVLSSSHSWENIPVFSTSKVRVAFTDECIQSLERELQEQSKSFWHVQSPESFMRLLLEENIDMVFTTNDIGPNEELDFQIMRGHLERCGILLFVEQNHELFRREQWPQKPHRGFTHFSEWKRRVPTSPAFTVVKENPNRDDSSSERIFTGGRKAGLRRLHGYFLHSRRLQHYQETRNGLLGDTYSSRLSPWLAFGCLDVNEVWQSVMEFEQVYGENPSTNAFKQELLWREYFRWVLFVHGRELFREQGLSKKDPIWRQDESDFSAWRRGETDSEFINAIMNELLQTGFIGNRARQIAASYLVNELQIDWRWGAAYFESQLIDYDVASNYGNWAYIAGVGTDPRGGRHFNLAYQQEQHDPDGAYVRAWSQNKMYI